MPLQKSQSVRIYGCQVPTVTPESRKQLKFMQNTFLNKFNAWAIKSDLGKVGTFPVNMSHDESLRDKVFCTILRRKTQSNDINSRFAFNIYR